MEHTVELLRKAEPLALKYDPDRGFYTGFSGGKDSQALFHMMQLTGVKFYAYFSPTSIDPPENIRFIKTHYPEVEFVKIETNIFDVFKDMKVLPSMKIRWCCAHFKERGGEGKVVCTGVRKTESVKRSKRNEIEVSGRKFSGLIDEFEDWQEKKIRKKMKNLNQDQFSEAKENEVRCINGKDKILLNPIIEWSESDVWEFLNKVVEVPHCELYDQGWTRIGCILCPMASGKSTARDLKRWPHVKEKWIKAIMDVRKESILGFTPPPSESVRKIFTLNGLYPHSQSGRANTTDSEQRGDDYNRTFSNCKSGYWRGVPIQTEWGVQRAIRDWNGAISISQYLPPEKRTQRNMVGKFLDSDNGEASAVVAEYDEAKERQIAEAIFDWWISKKSFKQWFAETYQQQKLDLDFDE